MITCLTRGTGNNKRMLELEKTQVGELVNFALSRGARQFRIKTVDTVVVERQTRAKEELRFEYTS